MKEVLLAVFTLCFVVGCGQGITIDDPIEAHPGKRPVEQVESFIRLIAEINSSGLDALESAVQSISNGEKPNARHFEDISPLMNVTPGEVRDRIYAFQDSPTGAYLTQQDEDYLSRLLDQKIADLQEQFGLIETQIVSMSLDELGFTSDISRRPMNLVHHLIYAESAIEWLSILSDEGISLLLKALRQGPLEDDEHWLLYCESESDFYESIPRKAIADIRWETTKYVHQEILSDYFQASQVNNYPHVTLLYDAILFSRGNSGHRDLTHLGYAQVYWNELMDFRSRFARQIDSSCG